MSPRTYQKRIARLMRLLEAVEWVQPTYNGSPSCSFCGRQQHMGHFEDCTLALTIGAPVRRVDSGSVKRGQ